MLYFGQRPQVKKKLHNVLLFLGQMKKASTISNKKGF
jgi:hypothetical protein